MFGGPQSVLVDLERKLGSNFSHYFRSNQNVKIQTQAGSFDVKPRTLKHQRNESQPETWVAANSAHSHINGTPVKASEPELHAK